STKIMQEEAMWRTKKNLRKGKPPVEPLYLDKDVENALLQIHSISYDQVTEINDEITLCFREAGHILGSASIETWIKENDEKVKIVFSGDLGPKDGVIEKHPAKIKDADIVLIESTYGDRLHKNLIQTRNEFQEIIKTALAKKGKILIPTFVVDRAQRLLFEFTLFQKKFPEIKMPNIYLDSPMGIATTEIYTKYITLLSTELQNIISKGENPFEPQNFSFIKEPADSQAINEQTEAIVLAGSGMCAGGRIMHHLKHNLFKKGTQVIFVGYQAFGTLGRRLVDGAKKVKIAGEEIRVAASLHTLGGFSAHADRDDLLDWASNFSKETLFVVVHGEPEASQSFAQTLRENGRNAIVPSIGDEITPTGKDKSNIFTNNPQEKETRKVTELINELDETLEEIATTHRNKETPEEIQSMLLTVKSLLKIINNFYKK
ncbi:MAG: MBL fold metallo-hydrolase, partial [Synergistaceae bacterium]